MKIALELDIDLFIEETEEGAYSLKDSVQNQILNAVVDKCFKNVSGKIDEQISEKILEQIKIKTDEVFESFISRKVVVTDRYGDTKEKGTIEDIIKNRFDAWNSEKVDEKSGKPSYYTESQSTRIEWIINSRLQKYGDEFVSRAVKEVSKKLEETLTENLRDMIGAKIAEKIGLNKLLKSGQ